jgi:hypothetical protein
MKNTLHEVLVMSEKTVQMTMLYDFFGDLLTDKQKEYFDLYYNEDYSLAEIAENVGITRQGVRDIIVRAENTLIETEEKTGLIKRFAEIRKAICQVEEYAEQIAAVSDNRDIDALTEKLLDIIRGLKG